MAYRSSSSNTGTSNAPTVSVPAGATAGDIAILVVSIDSQSDDFTAAWPSGFTELKDDNLTGDGHSVGLAWKRLTGADVGSYTLSAMTNAADHVIQCVLFSDRHATNPPVCSTSALNNSANGTPVTVTANGVTALDGDDLLFVSLPDVRASGVGNGHTPPSGYTEAQDTELGWSNAETAYKENVSAGATGSVSATFALTSSSSGWAAYLIRIPAAPSGTPTSHFLSLLGVGS